jgi:hypothetical protein
VPCAAADGATLKTAAANCTRRAINLPSVSVGSGFSLEWSQNIESSSVDPRFKLFCRVLAEVGEQPSDQLLGLVIGEMAVRVKLLGSIGVS